MDFILSLIPLGNLKPERLPERGFDSRWRLEMESHHV